MGYCDAHGPRLEGEIDRPRGSVFWSLTALLVIPLLPMIYRGAACQLVVWLGYRVSSSSSGIISASLLRDRDNLQMSSC